jgi:hypothetical protein
MRHLIVAGALLLAALAVTLGAATLLENMANSQRQEQIDQPPFVPGAETPERQPSPAPQGRPSPPEQSRSLSLLLRRT